MRSQVVHFITAAIWNNPLCKFRQLLFFNATPEVAPSLTLTCRMLNFERQRSGASIQKWPRRLLLFPQPPPYNWTLDKDTTIVCLFLNRTRLRHPGTHFWPFLGAKKKKKLWFNFVGGCNWRDGAVDYSGHRDVKGECVFTLKAKRVPMSSLETSWT